MRLLAFADKLKKAKERKPHIEDIFFEWPYQAKSYYCITHNTSIFFVLGELSNAWYFNEKTKSWEIKDFKDMGTFRACIEWFGLKPEEYTHLFDVEGNQDIDRFGGKRLNEDSKPADYAYNIIQFVFKRFPHLN
jgi:hypothetical protein